MFRESTCSVSSDRIGSTYESEVNSRNRNKYFFSRNRKPESEPQTFLTGIEPGIGSLFFQQSESESVPESEVTELHICHPYFLWTSRIAHIMGSYQLCLQGRGKIELLPLSLPTCTIYPGRQISGVHRRGGPKPLPPKVKPGFSSKVLKYYKMINETNHDLLRLAYLSMQTNQVERIPQPPQPTCMKKTMKF